MHRSGKSHSSVSSGVFSAVQDANVAIFGPLHYEPNYAYPLVVWLHGPGGDERQLRKVMPLVSMRNYVAVGPRGTWADAVGHTWRQGPDDVALAEQRVFEAIDVARCRFNVAENRVFLAGFDCGGTMAFHLAMQHPEAFSGVPSPCCTFPDGGSASAHLYGYRRTWPELLPGARVRKSAAVSLGRVGGHAAAVSVRRRIAHADAGGHGSLDHVASASRRTATRFQRRAARVAALSSCDQPFSV